MWEVPKPYKKPVKWAAIVIVVLLVALIADLIRLRRAMPVTLPPYGFFVGPQSLAAEGTWMREDASGAVDPQTSRLSCRAQEGRCLEFTAGIGYGGMLFTSVTEYPVVRWDDRGIETADVRRGCHTGRLRITMQGRRVEARWSPARDATGPDCLGAATETLVLTDGFEQAREAEARLFLPVLGTLRLLGLR